eukprot:1983577-Pleurochrysis_carterae.AAC.2
MPLHLPFKCNNPPWRSLPKCHKVALALRKERANLPTKRELQSSLARSTRVVSGPECSNVPLSRLKDPEPPVGQASAALSGAPLAVVAPGEVYRPAEPSQGCRCRMPRQRRTFRENKGLVYFGDQEICHRASSKFVNARSFTSMNIVCMQDIGADARGAAAREVVAPASLGDAARPPAPPYGRARGQGA